MNGHSIKDVDEALLGKFAALTTSENESVTVLIEAPSTSAKRTRVYPSIVITQQGAPVLDVEREEADTDSYVESYDDENDPTEATMAEVGHPYRLTYTVETFARTSTDQPGAAMDRELQEAVLTRLPPRGTLTVGADADVVSCFLATTADLNEVRGEVTVYHRVFTYEVLVVLAPQATSTEMVARSITLDFYAAAQDTDATVSSASPDNALDLSLNISSDGAQRA